MIYAALIAVWTVGCLVLCARAENKQSLLLDKRGRGRAKGEHKNK